MTMEMPERPTLDELLEIWTDDPSAWRTYCYAVKEQAERPGMVGSTLGNVDLAPGMKSWDVMKEIARRIGGPLPEGRAILVRLGKVGHSKGNGGYSPYARVEIDEHMFSALIDRPLHSTPAAPTTTKPADDASKILAALLAKIDEATKPKAEDPMAFALRIMKDADDRAERQQKLWLDNMKAMGMVREPGAPQQQALTTSPQSHEFWMQLGERVAGGGKESTTAVAITKALELVVAPSLARMFDVTDKGIDARKEIEKEKLANERKRLKLEETRLDRELAKEAAAAGLEVEEQPDDDDKVPALEADEVLKAAQ